MAKDTLTCSRGIGAGVTHERVKPTRVLFRIFPAGDVIALFPQELGDYMPTTCLSYQRIGQHGAADPQAVIGMTRPAAPSEYDDLAKELRQIGYDLDVRKRTTWRDYEIRKKKLGEA